MKPALKESLKTFRSSQPFNYLATTIARASLRAAGGTSEFCVKHLPRVGTVASRLPNGRTFKIRSRGDDWVSNQVFWRGCLGYEPESSRLFYRLAERSSVTIDVGAHVGYYAIVAAHANPQSRVFAFEPLTSVFERLLSNVALNGLTNVQSFASAVGETNGTATFYHVDVTIPCSSSLSREFMAWADDLEQLTVPVVTLDRFAAEHAVGGVDLIKIDTESTEPEVLRGAAGLLASSEPDIVCEVLAGCGSERPLEEFLRPLGYRFYLLTPDGPVEKASIEGHPQWFNYLFSKRKATIEGLGIAFR